MTAPAYARALIERRNRGERIGDAFVAVGWPSPWLREFVATSPCARNSLILATPAIKRYDWQMVIGLSVIVWFERSQEQARADELAEVILAACPLRLLVLNAVTGETRFLAKASEHREAA